MRVLILLAALAYGCYALTDEEIAEFYNDGCATPPGYVEVIRVGDDIQLSTNGIPDHKWQQCNPNDPGEQDTVVTFPTSPQFADHPYCLPDGAIGWAINGVAIYSPFAAGEVNAVDGANQETFDVCDGHATPGPDYAYHYHRLPSSCIYNPTPGSEQFIGVARDGFPIYGAYQADLERNATNADLDACHGRSITGDVDGYRYVFLEPGRDNYPYALGCFSGVPADSEAGSCETCSNGESPCSAVGAVCSCFAMGGGPPDIVLLDYDQVTVDGDHTPDECTDEDASENCRDPNYMSVMLRGVGRVGAVGGMAAWQGSGGGVLTASGVLLLLVLAAFKVL